MDLRSAVGSLQVPVAVVGGLLLVGALAQLAAMPEPPPGQDDIPHGFAVLFLYAVVWIGFVVGSLGLAIPPGDGYGIRFNRYQRLLFLGAAGAAFASLLLPIVAFGWLFATTMGGNVELAVLAWFGPSALAVIALVGGLGWRAAEEIVPRVRPE